MEALSGHVPVLDGLRRGGGAQLGHEDSHDVEEENEIDLWRGKKNQTQCDVIRDKKRLSALEKWLFLIIRGPV